MIILNNIYNTRKLLLFSIFLLSCIVSVVFLIILGDVGPSQHSVPGSDYSDFYEPVADNILAGKGITKDGEIALRYPPGYPIILVAIFGLGKVLGISKLGLIVFFNVIMSAISA